MGSPFLESQLCRDSVRVIVHFSFMTWMDMVVGAVVSAVIVVMHMLVSRMRMLVGMFVLVFVGVRV